MAQACAAPCSRIKHAECFAANVPEMLVSAQLGEGQTPWRQVRVRSSNSVNGPSLFDDEPVPIVQSTWCEVPQALYLSWSTARQLSYCAARDEDSALDRDTTEEQALWYLQRAQSYREMMKCLT